MDIDRYNPVEIENKWRKIWEKNKTLHVDLKKAKSPFYNLMMFPYPSGEGLHVGHVYAFGGSDSFGRFKRLQGHSVFEPMGFDSFGIHSENYAIKKGIHPKEHIEKSTTYFKEEQLKRLGALFDWDHQVITSDPDYYRWTQWLFTQLFKAGLALRKNAPVGWCPSCKTVLADEQVINGRCERCSTEVVQRQLEQWFFKITDYAEKLLNNLDHFPTGVYGKEVKLDKKAGQVGPGIDWSETTKTMQRNWIGRSEGTIIKFPVARSQRLEKVRSGNLSLETGDYIEVFTTRPDTIYGASFMVLAPEHKVALKISSAKFFEAVSKYITTSKKISEVERVKAKTGIFTGRYCINPFTKQEIPIWIADYVLVGYGTGAIMAVPAHDQRDYEFAKRYKLPIVEVISGGNIKKEAYIGEGRLINSGQFNGLGSKEAMAIISDYIESNRIGKKEVNYHLRDWLISRQRYWGPPIPMIYCESCADQGKSWFTTEESKKYKILNSKHEIRNKTQIQNSNESNNLEFKIEAGLGSSSTNFGFVANMAGWYPVPEKDLPVVLPDLKDYQPKGKGVSPLATLPDFVSVKCPGCGKGAMRETDVSDTFLDSSWYYLRYPSVGIQNSNFKMQNDPFDKTQGHPEQSRTDEKELELPWNKEINKKWLPVDMYIGGNEHAVMHLLYTRFITMALHDMGAIDFAEPFKKFRAHGLIIHEGAKMSKSRGNVVNPNEYMDAYGADTLRMYLLFIGPYELGGDFSDRAIAGIFRFLNRIWQLVAIVVSNPSKTASSRVLGEINRLVDKVETDLEVLKFNTAIAAIMEFANFAAKHKEELNLGTLKKLLIVLSVFAPFTAEELWNRIGESSSVHNQRWPKVEKEHLTKDKIVIPIQISGKLRGTVEVDAQEKISADDLTKMAMADPKISKHIQEKRIVRKIYVPRKILNIVVEGE